MSCPRSRSDARKPPSCSSRWTRQGWLRRVGPGAYAAAQLESLESEQVLDDPWILIPALYGPAYVGGWSAAEHWDLTEQIFRQILVMTTRPVRERHQTRHGTQFILRHIQERRLFGTKPVWRSRSRVPVSDVHRTVIVTAHPPASGFEVFVTVGERSGMWLSGMVCGWGSLMVTGG